MELALKCARDANANTTSDAASGFAMARAALTAAAYNVRINIRSLGAAASAGDAMLKELADLEIKAEEFEKEIRSAMKERDRV